MKPIGWIGSARQDLLTFPRDVVREIGHALFVAQLGGKHPTAKPLKGFGGAGTLEIVEDNDGETYRAVYTVKFGDIIYVLHVFNKKSKKGVATPSHEIDKIKVRLKQAEEAYEKWKRQKS
jgi:phage-related protein